MLELIVFSTLMALALSVDASLACLAYATTNKRNYRKINYAPILIGIFHFIFPIIAFFFFEIFSKKLQGIGNIISGSIFFILGIMCFIDKDEEINQLFTFTSVILLAIGVSIDSLLVGISLCFSIKSIFIPAIFFGIISLLASILAIKIGQCISKKSNFKLDYIVGVFFIILSLLTFFEVI